MIWQYVFIKDYDWRLIVLYNANLDLAATADALWHTRCPSHIAVKAIREMFARRISGFCYTNDDTKTTLICIAETNSNEDFINTVAHEIKHLQSHVCSYYGIDETSEEAAYLIGNITEELYRVFKYELE